MRRALACWLTACLACGIAPAAPAPGWLLARSPHFAVYAQVNEPRARTILAWFEQLRAFFDSPSFNFQGGVLHRGAEDKSADTVRVIVFGSEQAYQPYRLRASADAYYVANGSQNYIVLSTADPAKFAMAAHEYAHLALRASGLNLPPWLAEGLAEFFSTLQLTPYSTVLGGALPGRLWTLQTQSWIPMRDLLAISEDARRREDHHEADLLYAESWALTEMLILDPDYGPGFPQVVARISAGTPSAEALAAVYAKTPESLAGDLRRWVDQLKPNQSRPAIQLPEVRSAPPEVSVSSVPPVTARILLAQLLLAAGEIDRAQEQFTGILADAPNSAEVWAALGTIALSKHDAAGARRAWKLALDLGIADAQFCYQYAVLADQAGLAPEEIRAALERTVQLDPDFDDAHYRLALMEKNARHYEAALREFRAIRNIPESRAYAYWLALADIFNELGRRDEAQSAAHQASEHAVTAAERVQAAEQIHIAQTDVAVRFSRDASGELQLVTTRVPYQQTDWNPFIEPGDDMRRVQGTLREIECGDVTRIRVEDAGKLLTLAIPDLKHVQMRHAPAEFVCGPQAGTPVTIDYARTPHASSEGIVRGMTF
jgi:Tfp pilus assembly protein PilF